MSVSLFPVQGVSICLGTSLQIIPAANLPLRTVKSGGSLAIINLQATPKDKKATVVLHAKTDQVGLRWCVHKVVVVARGVEAIWLVKSKVRHGDCRVHMKFMLSMPGQTLEVQSGNLGRQLCC